MLQHENGKINSSPKKRFILKGKTSVFIDWANVYGWTKSRKREVDAEELFGYLETYPEIVDIRLYFGLDTHPKSEAFLKEVSQIGYMVVQKPVKYIQIVELEGQKIYRRKCDFDMEVCIDTHRAIKEGYDSFVFFTGDGDYEPLYKMLIGLQKQVIVVYTAGHLGREIWAMKKGIFKIELKNLMNT